MFNDNLFDKSLLWKIENNKHKNILLSVSKKVEFPLSNSVKECILLLKKALDNKIGVGIAAPQIGYPYSIMAIQVTKEQSEKRLLCNNAIPFKLYFNPSFTNISNEKNKDWEGCLSVDSECGQVKRYTYINITYQDEQGKVFNEQLSNFYARVFQHETDHLNGKLIIHHFENDDLHGSFKEMEKYK